MAKQTSFFKTNWTHRYCGGGDRRKLRAGRLARPLSSKEPLHLVLKINRNALPQGLRHPRTQRIIQECLKQYKRRFGIRVIEFSIQRTHIHALIRAPKRQAFQAFFKVFAGQIAQRVTGTFRVAIRGAKIWRERPFSRVVRGYKAYRTAREYVRLNEAEVTGQMPYQKDGLRGLTAEQRAKLWENSV